MTMLEDTKCEEFLKELDVDPVSANTYEKKVYVLIDLALLNDPTGTQTINPITDFVARDIKAEQIEQAVTLLVAQSLTVAEKQIDESQHEQSIVSSVYSLLVYYSPLLF